MNWSSWKTIPARVILSGGQGAGQPPERWWLPGAAGADVAGAAVGAALGVAQAVKSMVIKTRMLNTENNFLVMSYSSV